jgi:alcohol dehydrogenase class IV
MPDREPGFRQDTAVSVYPGALERLPRALESFVARRTAVVIDPNLVAADVGDRVLDRISAPILLAADSGEPTLEGVLRVADALRAERADSVVAAGGGSTLDTAKLARGFAATGAKTLGEIPAEIDPGPMPLIAIPTTAGTGAEIGAGAIVLDDSTGDKVLFRRRQLAAAIALADGDMTLGLPPLLTAFTGLDAFAQALLAFVPAGEHSVSGQNAIASMATIRAYLPLAVRDGSDRDARGRMMLGSVLSALAMYNAPPTYSGEHIFAESIGPALGAHHGHAVAALLTGTIEFNLEHLSDAFSTLARRLGLIEEQASDQAASAAFLADVRELVERLGIPPLGPPADGVELDDLAIRCERHDGYALNPRPLSREDAKAVLRGAFDGTFAVSYVPVAVASHE